MKKSWLIACALFLCASTVSADVISDWNIRTGQTIAPLGMRRGPSATLDFAMVHIAMHDAVQAYERRFEPYCAALTPTAGSPVAAASKAARDVLAALFPAQTPAIDAAYAALTAQYIGQHLMVANDAGIAVGEQAAACILERKDADNLARARPDTFIGGTAPGEWRPTSPVPMSAEFLATCTPFTMREPSQFRLANGPPHLTSGAYLKAYNEVKDKGASDATGHTRTQAETDIARFFSDGPPTYWNRLLRDLGPAHSLNLGDNARMFALVNMALADAIIASWDSKIAWNFWRPITGIRNGDDDGNSRTIGRSDWAPFAGTPNYPDYTSGANNLSGAATTMLANLFGTDELTFSLFSNTAAPLSPSRRDYTRLSDAARDVVDARIYMGIHFRFADTTALRQGRHVANWAFGHFLRPIEGRQR
jgi:hypothetical protein